MAKPATKRRTTKASSAVARPAQRSAGGGLPTTKEAIYQDAYAALCSAVQGVGGMFDEQSARSCVRAVRAIASEVERPTKAPEREPKAQPPAASGDGHATVEELDDELRID